MASAHKSIWITVCHNCDWSSGKVQFYAPIINAWIWYGSVSSCYNHHRYFGFECDAKKEILPEAERTEL